LGPPCAAAAPRLPVWPVREEWKGGRERERERERERVRVRAKERERGRVKGKD